MMSLQKNESFIYVYLNSQQQILYKITCPILEILNIDNQLVTHKHYNLISNNFESLLYMVYSGITN